MGDDQYSDEEAKRRFEAALRGARVAAKKEMKDIPSKRKRTARRRIAESVKDDSTGKK